MTWAAGLSLAVTLAVIVCLVIEVAAPEVLLLGAVTVLMAAGVVTPSEALGGFGSVAVLTIASLLVVAAGVRRTGMLTYAANLLFGRRQTREPLLRLMLPAGTLSAFLNNTPIVAMFVPAVIEWCRRNDLAPSRMLMPLSFATIVGGLCTLIGTSTTLVVDGLMREQGLEGLGMFEIAWIGVPVAVSGIALIWFLAPRVLPDRRDPVAELGDERREYLVEMIVDNDSPLVGSSIGDAGLRNLPGLFLINIERHEQFIGPVAPQVRLEAGDRLVFTGVAATVVDLRRFPGLSPAPEAHYDPTAVARRNRLFEVVVSGDSPLVGSSIRNIGFRSRYDASVIAVHRAGERLPKKLGDVVLQEGDTLMIEASKGFDKRWGDSRDFVLVSRVRAEPPPTPQKAPIVTAVVAVLVLVVTLEWLPMVVAAFAAVGAMLLFRVLTVREASRAVDLPIVIVIAGAIGLGRALDKSGAAQLVADLIFNAGSWIGPTGILAAVYLCANLINGFITNVATAAILFPVVLRAAQEAQIDPRPFAITLVVAATANFLTPTGYQTNLMVYGPGGYRFTDFARLGVPLAVLVMILTLAIVPIVWPLA